MPNEYIMTPQGRREMTDAEQAKVDASRVKTLKMRKAEVEAKTRKLLEQGLEYPAGSGIMHALTEERLQVYNAAKARMDLLSYPRRFKASSGDIISLINEEAFVDFDNKLTAKYTQIVDQELDLLEALYNANGQEELDAVIDNR